MPSLGTSARTNSRIGGNTILTNTNKKLEKIAKQVSLLNRLIELLMMQENPLLMDSGLFKWAWDEPTESYLDPETGLDLNSKELRNHPITQKLWSDELVKVARELEKTEYSDPFYEYLELLTQNIMPEAFPALYDVDDEYRGLLEAILNKHGRSLNG